MKSHSFFKGLSYLLLLNFLVKPAWIFFIDREVQNRVGHETYGSYFALFNLSLVLYFIADAGLSNLLNQKLAAKEQANSLQYFSLKLVFCLGYILVAGLVGGVSRLEQWDLFLYLLAIQVLSSLSIFFRSLITAHQYYTAGAWFSVMDKLLMIGFCAGFIYAPLLFGPISLPLFLQCQVSATAVSVFVALAFVLKKGLLGPKPKKEATRTLLLSLLPFALIILLMSMHDRLDAYLLERLHPNGAFEAGIYAAAYRLLDATNVAGYLAGSFLVPFIARNQGDTPLLKETVTNVRHGLFFLGIGIASFALFFPGFIQELLYHTTDTYNSRVIQLTLAVIPAYLLMHVYGSILTATARFRSLIMLILVSVGLNLALNLLLIPAYGAIGCCLAALVSHYFCVFACYRAASRENSWSVMSRSLPFYAAIAAALCLFFYGCRVAMLNVWLILVLATGAMLLLLATQISFIKKYLSRYNA